MLIQDGNVPQPSRVVVAGDGTEPAEAVQFPAMDQNSAVLEAPAADSVVEDELLIEEISIDGMCGVY